MKNILTNLICCVFSQRRVSCRLYLSSLWTCSRTRWPTAAATSRRRPIRPMWRPPRRPSLLPSSWSLSGMLSILQSSESDFRILCLLLFVRIRILPSACKSVERIEISAWLLAKLNFNDCFFKDKLHFILKFRLFSYVLWQLKTLLSLNTEENLPMVPMAHRKFRQKKR